MPLAPGLGCAGLFYLNGADELVESTTKDTTGNTDNRTSHNHEGGAKTYDEIDHGTYDEIDHGEDTDDDEDDGTQLLAEQLQSLRQT